MKIKKPQPSKQSSVFDNGRFGQFLKKARRRRDLSQDRLAEDAGISSQLVSNLENGRGTPSVDTICALARALNLTAAEVLNGGIEGEQASLGSDLDRVAELFSRLDAREIKETLHVLDAIGRMRSRD